MLCALGCMFKSLQLGSLALALFIFHTLACMFFISLPLVWLDLEFSSILLHLSFLGVYRLDRLTSGVLVFCKTQSKANEIQRHVRGRLVEKEYVCKVEGEFPRCVCHD